MIRNVICLCMLGLILSVSSPAACAAPAVPLDTIGGDWQVITDKLWCKGTSEANMEIVTGPDGSKRSLKFDYALGKRPEGSPFADLTCKYTEDKDFYSGFSGIKFKMKGSGGKIRVVFISSNVSTWNYWGYIIDSAPSEWTEYAVKWTDLRPGWASTEPLKESLARITELQFHTEGGKEGDKGWLEVDDIGLIVDKDAKASSAYKVFTPHIDVNQAFYAPRDKKKAVVRCDGKPGDGKFSVIDGKGNTVLSGRLDYWGEYWKKHFWTMDFSKIKEEGEYTIKADFGNNISAESKVIISRKEILKAAEKTLEYFYLQRCGTEVEKWHKLCHADDGVLPDGTHFDATGGWHDCAGYDKEMYTNHLPVYVFTTIAYEADGKLKARMIEEAKWGANWVMRMTDDKGYTWCHVEPHNLPPEEFIKIWSNGTDTDNIIGTADDRKLTKNAWGPEEGVQAANMGALVKLGYLLRDEDRDYSARCIAKAKSIMEYLKNKDYYYAEKINLGRGNSHYNLFHAGMLLADIYLYKYENKSEYLEDARNRIDYIINNCQTKTGESLNSSIERVPASGRSLDPYFDLICFYDFYKQFPGDPYIPKIKRAYQGFMEGQVVNRVSQSPYGQAQLLDSDLLNYISVNTLQRNFLRPEGSSQYSQGKNCYWLSLATVCFYADDLLGTKKYAEIAVNQMNWVTGENPFGLSTVADVGYRFPRMFTMWYWLKDHPGSGGVIPGGVINGIGGGKEDMPFLDLKNNNWMAWETNEYWNPPTAWFAMAAWRYYKWAEVH